MPDFIVMQMSRANREKGYYMYNICFPKDIISVELSGFQKKKLPIIKKMLPRSHNINRYLPENVH